MSIALGSKVPRPPRHFSAGAVYHVLNRGVRRHQLFDNDGDYVCFQQLMARAQQRTPLRLLGYCLMPNHWHLVVWPECAMAVPAYLRWLTWCHACHFNRARGFSGHVYQGRYRSVAVRDERQLIAVLRYVEGNALRAGLVERPEGWRWCSLSPVPELRLTESPVRRPDNWLELLL
jgi:putative transposase